MANARLTIVKTYQGITEVARMAEATGEVRKAPDIGDLTEQTALAATILRNWLAVTRHNIGSATTMRLLQAAIDECAR